MDGHESIILPSDIVTVTKMNHVTEIQQMEKMNNQANIVKIDKDRYVLKETGEIHTFNKSETRKDNHNSLRQTFKKLRYLINNNFIGYDNELHCTLTYAENMTDTKRLYRDFDSFKKRLKRKFNNFDYLDVVEPQERGAWHHHLLLRFNGSDKAYIKNSDLAKIWSHGYVTIKNLKDVDNIGAYLSAYLADIELTDKDMSLGNEKVRQAINKGLEVREKVVDGEQKKFIKGGRLHLYPPGMNLYRKSKGIVFPERQKMSYKQAKKIVGNGDPHYSRIYNVEINDFENTIIFEQYNSKK
ncbi:rolling circle replication-associated protein [Virgibacillus ndiopensis]|uniref:rolling circle replication-associated protein n=1 Tax=Virgibacillus ndiopensis TaxID=2004408 RepID=UPI001FE6F307|nr:hypothetical protein [Virgibacillus ndiopensis]